MIETDGTAPAHISAAVVVVPVVVGVLGILMLLAAGQSATMCTGVQQCADPAERLAVAVGWTIAVAAAAMATVVLRLRTPTPTAVRWARAAFVVESAAIALGVVATLSTGGFALPLLFV